MTKEEKIQAICKALSKKAGELAVDLKRTERQIEENEDVWRIGIFLTMLSAKEIADALEFLHKEVNLI